ncbi:hypothetical protein ID866_7323 [Astraeus odoratus]|nr:hypothetical protein ID866_7323 [Astraeus odoratus]
MERMGLGPDLFYDNDGKKGLNDRLIYARIAGFPPDSPYKFMAGHELSYLATSGVLSMLPGSPEKPAGAILADFAGGGLMCATGILLAVVERTKSGRGQVVDVNLVAGTRYVSSYPLLHHVASTSSILGGPRGTNLYDGGAPFYDIYTCSDGQWISVACLEPEFFAIFIERFNTALQASGVKSEWIPTHKTQSRKKDWPKLRGYLEDGFRRMPRDFWASIFHGSDACAMPVLTPEEASQVGPSGSLCPAPHPHLSRTPPLPQEGVQLGSTLEPGTHTMQVLIEVGLSRDEIEKLTLDGAFGNDSYITISRSKL